MSDSITLEFLGATLRAIQAEQRTLRMENELIRKELARFASREELLEVLRRLVDRIANFEALMEARYDHMEARMEARFGESEARMEARFGESEARMEARFDQLSGQLAQLAEKSATEVARPKPS